MGRGGGSFCSCVRLLEIGVPSMYIIIIIIMLYNYNTNTVIEYKLGLERFEEGII